MIEKVAHGQQEVADAFKESRKFFLGWDGEAVTCSLHTLILYQDTKLSNATELMPSLSA